MSEDHRLRAVRDAVDARADEVTAFVQRLVEIESPSGDVEGSRAVVDALVREARSIPAVTSVERIDSPGCGEHLRLGLFGATPASARTTLVVGHTDTVHPRGSVAARPVRVEAGRLFGPGVFDMKANCAVVLEAARVMSGLGLAPRVPVVALLTCDEEIGSHSGRPLVEHEARRACAAFVLEPSAPGGRAKTARKGVGLWTVAAHGVAAHAGLDPTAGASAIVELARQVVRLHELTDLALGTTYNAGTIRGGTGSNVVAADAEAEVDVRFSTLDEARRVEELMRTLAPFDPRVHVTATGAVNRPPLERTSAVERLYLRARALAEQIGFELGEQAVGGASDGNFIAALGVPVLDGLGVEGDGAHAAHEHVVVADLARRVALLAGLLLDRE
jgi:glutamate carboxypeptidase